ncbi:MAG TPA: thiamine pyrophosphate-binding protein [Streptosporangiaceae bacterium]|jgi:thiamine pyrophosphate-dependent acetolactate synthase large subunit-like protein
MTSEMTAYAVGRALAGLGARRCFGVVGSGNFHVTTSLVGNGVEFIAARHECNAVTMADAYARMTGELTLASVHPGPGITNAVTAITEAAKSRTPLVVLAGDTANGALRSNFHLDQTGLVTAIGAVAERLYSPATAVDDAVRAARRALDERRTVVLNMPLDVQAAPAPDTPPPGPGGAAAVPYPDPARVRELADAVGRARRPVVIAGRGALVSGAGDALAELAELTGALLATSACAHGMFAGNPWSLGISGGFSSPAAAELISESDLLLGFGVSYTQWTTRHGALVGADTTVAQVDVEPERLGWQRPVDLGVLGDARATAEALTAELRGRGHRPAARRDAATARRIADGSNHAAPYDDASTPATIDPRTLSKAVDALLPDARTVALDSGHFMGWPARYLRVPDAAGWVFTQAFQSIGLGLATAIGAAVARPDRLTVAAVGDGGLLMSIADLETAVRLGLRLFVLVYDDAAYSAEVHHFGPMGHPTKIVEFPDTDIAAIARGYGAHGAVIRTEADLEAVRAWLADGAQGVFVADAKVTPALAADWLEEAFRGEH